MAASFAGRKSAEQDLAAVRSDQAREKNPPLPGQAWHDGVPIGRSAAEMTSEGANAGTPWRSAGFLPMRATILLPLLMLAACGDRQDEKSGVVTNIVDQTLPDVRAVPEGSNGIQTAEPAPASPAREAPSGSTMPASVQGRWKGLDESCADRATELELTVTPTSLIFLESEGKVTGLSHGPDGAIRIDAAFTGEGQSWTKRLELRPSANGRELTVLNDGRAVTRKRCS